MKLSQHKKIYGLIVLFMLVISCGIFALTLFEKEEKSENLSRGYIKAIYEKENKNYVDVDYIQWFTGEEAKQKAFELGKCQKLNECAEEGYFILNNLDKLRSFPINTNISFSVVNHEFKPFSEKIDFETFKKEFEAKKLDNALFDIKVESSQIVSIKEVCLYTPELSC